MAKKIEVPAVPATVAAFPMTPATEAVAVAVVPFTYTVKFTDDKGKPQTMTKSLPEAVDKALSDIVGFATEADDNVTNHFEAIVSATFGADFAPIVGESVAILRARMFACPEYQFLYGVMQQKHRKWAPAQAELAKAKEAGEKTAQGEIHLAAAKGLTESLTSTAGHQARNIVRKWAAKFGVSVEGGDKASQSARGQIEEFIGELNAKLEKPRGDEKLEGERKMRRGAVELLRAYLANTHGTAANPFGLTEPAGKIETPERANGPVVTLTKEQIAEMMQ